MPLATGRFRRTDRILHSRDFQRILGNGERTASRYFVVFMTSQNSELEHGERERLGITVSKRVGNAVTRNRVKRRVREWFRSARGELPAGSELVVIARSRVGELGAGEIRDELDRVLARHRVILDA